jgi:hypothetical protein
MRRRRTAYTVPEVPEMTREQKIDALRLELERLRAREPEIVATLRDIYGVSVEVA